MAKTMYTFGANTYETIEELLQAIREEIEDGDRGMHTLLVDIERPITWEEVVEEATEYLTDNDGDLADVLEELDDLTGRLGDDRIHPIEEVDDIVGGSIYDFIQEIDELDPSADYFTYGRWGFRSVDYRDYTDMVDEDLVQELYDHKGSLDYLPDEVRTLFDDYEACGVTDDENDEDDETDEDTDEE